MRITVLGSAAGGGFPQWNCNCHNCAGLRAGTVRAQGRTQSSLFVQPGAGGMGVDGVLFNASPDILEQIKRNPVLQPGRALRDTAIAGVVLMDGQIDHATGLFMLRERGTPLPLWCTDPVYEDLTQGNPVLRVLGHYCGVERHCIDVGGPLGSHPFEVPGVPGLRFNALPLASKAAPYSPHRAQSVVGDNIGMTLVDATSGRRAFYAPGLGHMDGAVFDALCGADAVLVDGTFWTDDEMVAMGLSTKTARSIGHLPQSGAGGMLESLARLPARTRKLLIHINNTNPVLDEDSPQRALLNAAGVEVCADGMTIDL